MGGCACFFFALGLGAHAGNFDNDGAHLLHLENPLGRVAAGYEFENGIALKVEHTSQIEVRDTGLNLLLIEKRWNWKP
jgi:hypothetical protein